MNGTSTPVAAEPQQGRRCSSNCSAPAACSTVTMYTDGACLRPHGPGGAAAVFINDGDQSRQWVWGITECTNNRAELIAVIEGLKLLPNGSKAVVKSDSQYLIDGTDHLARWARNGWTNKRRRKCRRIANLDLWKQLHRVIKRRRVTFQKVAAHSGVTGNERADQLAYWAALFTNGSSDGTDQPEVFCICSCTGDDVPMTFVGLDEVRVTSSLDPLYLDPTYLPKDVQMERRFNPYYGSGQGAGNRPVHVHDPWKVAVDAHVGNHRDFLQRYVRAAATEELYPRTPDRKVRTFFSKLFEYATDFRMLRCAFDLTAQSGATARGVDGMTIDDYANDRLLLTSTLKELETSLRNGQYHPRRLRRVLIPKPGGRGKRPIDIPTVEDRIVDRALLLTLAPLLEPRWHICNIGFRRGHGIQDGLAMVEWLARKGTHTVVQTTDIRKAFTSLPKCRLISTVQQALPVGTPKQLTTLMANIIRRPLPHGDGIRTTRGIPQGSPLSPMLLNIYLNRYLEGKWDHQRWPMIRYADDILLLATSRTEADEALRTLKNLLRPNGLNLREDTPAPAELTCGDTAEWLGFQLSSNSWRVQFDLSEAAWDRLEVGLQEAQATHDPTQDATSQVLSGWLDYAGSVYRRGRSNKDFRKDFVDRVATALRQAGVSADRMPKRVIHHTWGTAGRRWRKRRRRIQEGLKRMAQLHTDPWHITRSTSLS